MPQMKGNGAIPVLVSTCRIRTNGSPGRSSMVRSSWKGVITPVRSRRTCVALTCWAVHGIDHASPRYGSSSPSTTHGAPVGTHSSMPPVHQLSTFTPNTGWRTATLGWW